MCLSIINIHNERAKRIRNSYISDASYYLCRISRRVINHAVSFYEALQNNNDSFRFFPLEYIPRETLLRIKNMFRDREYIHHLRRPSAQQRNTHWTIRIFSKRPIISKETQSQALIAAIPPPTRRYTAELPN